MGQSPFFKIKQTAIINTFEELLDIAQSKEYLDRKQDERESPDQKYYTFEYRSSPGLYRGQNSDWDLAPSAYRNGIVRKRKEARGNGYSEYVDYKGNGQFHVFREQAQRQNRDFPKMELEQMIIAQHYGIKTPLLDWTRNIFVAVYFAINQKLGEELSPENVGFIYHIRNEGLIRHEKLVNNYLEEQESFLVNALPIDRRVERQAGCFTFHPHPDKNSSRIEVDKYILTRNFYSTYTKIIKATGFTSEYLFPDYAGLADRIKQGYYY